MSTAIRNRKLFVLRCAALLALAASPLAAQTDRGAVTGLVLDTSGSLIPKAKITLTNVATGFQSETVTTETGNYTLAALPAGTYSMQVEAPGFSRYEQTNIMVQVAVTTRVEVTLKVGAATESVQVTAESTLLKEDDGEVSFTVEGSRLNDLPINFGIGAGAIRNPLSFAQLVPGATINGWNNITINGANGGFKILYEGQESSSSLDPRVSDESQPSVETISEFTLQTSNFAAEFGTVGSGLFNFTSKSGSNQFHGSGYIYLQNTAFNAGLPYTDDGRGEHVKIVKHLANGGFSLGGPVLIPKVYNGKNKTFFFMNWEKYRDREALYNGITTVPDSALAGGDFSSILGRNLATDFAGRAILQNAIYDPSTATLDSAGRRVLQVFPGNVIPRNRFDPTSVKILSLFPKPNIADTLVNNYVAQGPFYKLTLIPSIKIDHSFSNNIKVSGYYSWQDVDKSNGVDGLPEPLSVERIQVIRSKTFRLNYDHTLSPTLLLHVGAGYIRYHNPDTVPPESADFDTKSIGIPNAPGTGFPKFGAGSLGNNVYGGMALAMGPNNRGLYVTNKPTATAQLTWIRGNHSYKGGAEFKHDDFTNMSDYGLSPFYSFSTAETAQPLYGQALPNGTTIGHGLASFLLGGFDSASVGNSVAPQYRRNSWGFFVQDTWKVTRRLTLDYGIRYDLQMPNRELWDRTSTFSRLVVNPNANGRLGGILYSGYGAGRCNCQIVATYPYAIAPRLGWAYRPLPKTVLRGGIGISYGQVPTFSYIGGGASQGMGFNTVPVPAVGNGVAAGQISNPLNYTLQQLNNASYDPGLLVNPGGTIQNAPNAVDPNGGRPPRTVQWNFTLQREVRGGLLAEVAYVGNRAAWLNAGGGLTTYNAINADLYKSLGLDLTTASTRTLLTSQISSPIAVNAGYKKPYANFPDSGTVVQSLRPFPQFNTIGTLWAPLGASWYNAVQAKLVKRYSKGFTFTASYSFSKTLDSYEGNGYIFDRSSFKGLAVQDRPQLLSVSLNYTVPVFGFTRTSKVARAALSGWTIGTVSQYASGALLPAPGSNNGIGAYLPGSSSRQFRVPGQPLYLKNPNCHCYDPTVETILNPAAWVDQAPGGFGSGTVYYSDFRGQRRPVESVSFGKRFPLRERLSFSLRAEVFNPLNRNEVLSDPATGSPSLAPTRSPKGLLTGGFGYVNYTAITSNSVGGGFPSPRTAQIVARLEF
ncbi:MAG: TonB-dependent receptor [Acidobacteriota bacterium]|nr:TonB-dependent receptor [Acidobacteriota bacterium]